MQGKSILAGILIAGLSALCWGFAIAVGFWLAHRFLTQPLERKLDERKAKKIANKAIEDLEKECSF